MEWVHNPSVAPTNKPYAEPKVAKAVLSKKERKAKKLEKKLKVKKNYGVIHVSAPPLQCCRMPQELLGKKAGSLSAGFRAAVGEGTAR